MVLDTIIELENKFIKSKRKPPTIVRLSYLHYCALIRELDETHFIDSLHGMKLKIVDSDKIEVL